MRGLLSSGKSKLVAASPHCLPKPRCICASAATAHLCLVCQSTFVQRHGSVCASLGLPHNAPQWRRVSGGPPLSGRGGSGKQGTEVARGLCVRHQTKPFRRQRLPSPSSVRGLWGSDMREGQSDESLELEGTLPVGNESAVTPLSSSFVHLSLKVDLRLIFLWRAVTNVPYIEGPVVLCIVGNNSGFPS